MPSRPGIKYSPRCKRRIRCCSTRRRSIQLGSWGSWTIGPLWTSHSKACSISGIFRSPGGNEITSDIALFYMKPDSLGWVVTPRRDLGVISGTDQISIRKVIQGHLLGTARRSITTNFSLDLRLLSRRQQVCRVRQVDNPINEMGIKTYFIILQKSQHPIRHFRKDPKDLLLEFDPIFHYVSQTSQNYPALALTN